MITYRFFIRPQFSSEQAWEELENFGAQPLYSEETEGSKEVVASLGDIPFSDFPFLLCKLLELLRRFILVR